MPGPVLSALLPVLIKVGTPFLAEIIRQKSPAAAVVVEKVAGALGVEPTEQAIADAYQAEPQKAAAAIKAVEQADPAFWQAFAVADTNRAALLEREDKRESFFSWGWRPAMSWTLIFLWVWSLVLIPLANAIARAGIAAPSMADLTTFTGIWLAIYGGGHTLKAVLGK